MISVRRKQILLQKLPTEWRKMARKLSVFNDEDRTLPQLHHKATFGNRS